MTAITRSLLVAIALLFPTLTPTAHAAVPQRVTFTARLVNAGATVQGPVQVTLNLFRAQSGGTSVWTEAHSATATDGLISLGMGEQSPFDPMVLDGGALFLEVTVDSTVLSPRLAIGSVPYALVAERADKLGELAADDLQRRIFGTCPTGSSVQSIDATGAVTCEVDDDTKNTFGAGLLESGGAVSIDPAIVQRRVTASCAAGSSISAIAADGSVSCEVDNDTAVTAGPGISISPANVVTTDNNFVQRRVATSCAVGSSIRTIFADGSVSCEPDTDTDTNTTYAASCPTGQFVRFLSSTGTAVCGGVTPVETLTGATVNGTQVERTTIAPRTFCALTHVQTNASADLFECSLVQNANLTWTLTINGNNSLGVIVTCTARCM